MRPGGSVDLLAEATTARRMAMMNTASRRWYSFLVDLAIRMHVYRPGRDEVDEQVRRKSFETNTSRWSLRITDFLRDRLRLRWMRVKK